MSEESKERDEILSAYLDGELDESERETVKLRIEKDDAWRERYEKMRRTSQAMQDFFKKSGGVEPSRQGEDDAIHAIVRESTLVLRRSQVKGGLGHRRPGNIIIVGMLALAVVLAVVFFMLDDRPDPSELLEAPELGEYLELRFDFGDSIAVSAHPFLEALAPELLPKTGLLTIGPDGLLHLEARFMGKTRHAGFDGTRNWRWDQGDDHVRLLGPNDDPLIVTAHNGSKLWKLALDDIADWKEQADDWSVLAGEKLGPDGEIWWKLAHEKTTAWFDERRQLRRVKFDVVTIHITPRRLTVKDFQPETVAPGIPIK